MANKPVSSLKHRWIREAYAPSIWDIANEELYELCRRYSRHKRKSAVAAKIWLIGRSYSVAIERGVAGKGKADEFITKRVVPRICSGPVDRWLAKLPKEPVDLSNSLQLVIRTFKLLEKHLSKICRGRRRESFTSKYLHFHRPDLFPIFDSRARFAIAQITPDARFCARELELSPAEDDYEKFVIRCVWLAKKVAEKRRRIPTLRQVDNLLLRVHRELKGN
jgi:hypothetical protein